MDNERLRAVEVWLVVGLDKVVGFSATRVMVDVEIMTDVDVKVVVEVDVRVFIDVDVGVEVLTIDVLVDEVVFVATVVLDEEYFA